MTDTGSLQGRFAYEGGALIPRETSEVAFFYGDDGSLDRIEAPAITGPGAIANSYDESTGRLTQQSRPGQIVTYQYGLVGQIEEMTTTTGPGGAFGYQTRYDPAGNVIEMGGSYYTYDALGRLKTVHDAETGDNYEYQYDLASNRTEVTRTRDGVSTVTQSLGFTTADKIDTAANPEFAYDSAGRLISDTTASGEKRSYHWDGYGRLSGVNIYSPTTGHSENLRMSYDAAGRLSEKRHYIDLTWPVERLFYHYDGDRLVSEEDMTGTVREYLYAGGEAPTAMRARQSDGTFKQFFFVTNTHGDVVAVTDRDGNIVNRYAYGPWGEATRVSESVHQPFRYAGYRYEDGFDLYYLRARWYDAGTGRFLSRDPLRGSPGNLRSVNRYIYGGCAPPTMVDPGGRSPRCAGGHADLPSAWARGRVEAHLPSARVAANALRIPLELILNVIYHENDFDPPWRKALSASAYRAGNVRASVGPMNVSRLMARHVAFPEDNLLEPHMNILTGSSFLRHRMDEGAGLGSGVYDEWLTLVYQNYVDHREHGARLWDPAEIFGDPRPAGELDPANPDENPVRRFRDFCARLTTMRSYT